MGSNMYRQREVGEMKAICIREPRGDHGLEGFQLGASYKVAPVASKRMIVRVEPDRLSIGCNHVMTKRVFNKYFKQQKEEQ